MYLKTWIYLFQGEFIQWLVPAVTDGCWPVCSRSNGCQSWPNTETDQWYTAYCRLVTWYVLSVSSWQCPQLLSLNCIVGQLCSLYSQKWMVPLLWQVIFYWYIDGAVLSVATWWMLSLIYNHVFHSCWFIFCVKWVWLFKERYNQLVFNWLIVMFQCLIISKITQCLFKDA